MRKLFTIASLLLASYGAYGEAYQVNLQSAKQTGMGHTGVAMKLGSESMMFNPAALASMEDNVDISVGGSAVFATIDYKNGTTSAQTDNSASTPFYAYAAFKIYDNFAAGISVNTPYGSSLNWGKDWIGCDLVQDIALQSFSVQPTFSYRICDKLSIGAGLMANFGNVEISRALLPKGALTAMGMGAAFADIVPVSATLQGDAGVKLGYNVGLLYDVNDKLSLGVDYRSKVELAVSEGNAELIYASTAIQQGLTGKVPPLDKGTFSASMPMPANLTVGAAYQANDRLMLTADIQTVFWSAYEQLDIVFSQEVLGGYNISSVKNYKNTVIARVGSQYAVTDRFDLRLGLYFDQSPVRTDNYNPETPGMNKVGLSTGFSFKPLDCLSIDFAFLYIEGIEREGTVNYKNGLPEDKTFSGSYDSTAFAPTLGVSLNF